MISRSRRNTVLCLAAILVVAALLRLVNLDRHDLTDDEALLSFRGIGYFDTWFGSMKPPTELFTTSQWWQSLSFHDHPPLAFLVQHLSFRSLGISIWAARLPFALAGIATVLMVYLLGRGLAGRTYGLLAAAIMAVANYHVWISRVAFIESLVLLLVVTALWLLVRALQDDRYLLWLWLVVGLSLITKYSALVLVPVVVTVLWRFRPTVFRRRGWWLGVGLCLAVLSPVVVYNAMLYATRGHFDATLWSMLGQRHADFGTDDHPYAASLRAALAWLQWLPKGFDLFTLSLAAVGGALVLGRRPWGGPPDRQAWVLGAYTVSTVVFLSLSPGRKQYVALLIPSVILLGAMALKLVRQRLPNQYGVALILSGFVVVGGATVNSQHRAQPLGIHGLTYVALRPTSYAYHALDAYLDHRYADEPILEFPMAVPQYQAFQHQSYQARVAAGAQVGFPPFLIWDERFDYAATRWTLLRRPFYLHQPMILSTEADRFFKAYGISKLGELSYRQFIFAFAEPPLLAGTSFSPHVGIAAAYRQLLDARGAQPLVLYDRFNVPQFAIYETSTLAFLTEYAGPLRDPAVVAP